MLYFLSNDILKIMQLDSNFFAFLFALLVVTVTPAAIALGIIYSVIQFLKKRWIKSGKSSGKFYLITLTVLIILFILLTFLYFK